jgi:phosphoadenosine phosphosulfate reductase
MGLIASPRHRPRDLDQWSRLERTLDARVAKSPRLEARERAALDDICAFTVRCPQCCIAASWGKDSVVLAHLCWRAEIRRPLVHVAHDDDNPDSPAVRDAFLARWPMEYHELMVCDEEGDDDLSWAASCRAFFAEMNSRWPTRLSGLRAEESSARKMRAKIWGISSPNTCAPLQNWRVTDVFGYLCKHDLPVHPVYAMLGEGRWERATLRVDVLGGRRGTEFGRAEWERLYYPEFQDAPTSRV